MLIARVSTYHTFTLSNACIQYIPTWTWHTHKLRTKAERTSWIKASTVLILVGQNWEEKVERKRSACKKQVKTKTQIWARATPVWVACNCLWLNNYFSFWMCFRLIERKYSFFVSTLNSRYYCFFIYLLRRLFLKIRLFSPHNFYFLWLMTIEPANLFIRFHFNYQNDDQKCNGFKSLQNDLHFHSLHPYKSHVTKIRIYSISYRETIHHHQTTHLGTTF